MVSGRVRFTDLCLILNPHIFTQEFSIFILFLTTKIKAAEKGLHSLDGGQK